MTHLPNCLQLPNCGCDLLGKSKHECTSNCRREGCPLCAHGKLETEPCKECDETASCTHCNKSFLIDDMQVIGDDYFCAACAELDERDSVSSILNEVEQENFKSAIMDQGI